MKQKFEEQSYFCEHRNIFLEICIIFPTSNLQTTSTLLYLVDRWCLLWKDQSFLEKYMTISTMNIISIVVCLNIDIHLWMKVFYFRAFTYFIVSNKQKMTIYFKLKVNQVDITRWPTINLKSLEIQIKKYLWS